MPRPVLSVFVAAAVLLLTTLTAAAQTTPASTAFTYQARVELSGQPFEGDAALGFVPYDAPVGGLPVADPVLHLVEGVENGLISVPLDFGAIPLAEPVYLEIIIQREGLPAETLAPRQLVRPSPAAVQAAGAEVESPSRVVFTRGPGLESSAASQPATDGFTSAAELWQSFTATRSGPLSSISVSSITQFVGGAPAWTLYRGEGTGGAPIVGGAGTSGPVGEVGQTVWEPAGASIEEGEVYTFAIASAALQYGNAAGAYAGGRSSLGPGNDLTFRVDVLTEGPATAAIDNGAFIGAGVDVSGDVYSGPVTIGSGSTNRGLTISGFFPEIELNGTGDDPHRYRSNFDSGDGWITTLDPNAWRLSYTDAGAGSTFTALQVSGSSRRIGAFTFPAATVHVVDPALGAGVAFADLSADTAVIEAEKARLGLYSETSANSRSCISLGWAVDGRVQEKWSILTAVSGNDRGLYFTLGSTPDAGQHDPKMALTADGDVIIPGQLSQGSSAERKADVRTIRDAVGILLRLRGVRYTWEQTGKQDIGFVAEEMAQVLPEIVAFDKDNTPVGIDYGRVSALTVEAIREQRTRLDAQRTLIEELTRRVERLEEQR